MCKSSGNIFSLFRFGEQERKYKRNQRNGTDGIEGIRKAEGIRHFAKKRGGDTADTDGKTQSDTGSKTDTVGQILLPQNNKRTVYKGNGYSGNK